MQNKCIAVDAFWILNYDKNAECTASVVFIVVTPATIRATVTVHTHHKLVIEKVCTAMVHLCAYYIVRNRHQQSNEHNLWARPLQCVRALMFTQVKFKQVLLYLPKCSETKDFFSVFYFFTHTPHRHLYSIRAHVFFSFLILFRSRHRRRFVTCPLTHFSNGACSQQVAFFIVFLVSLPFSFVSDAVGCVWVPTARSSVSVFFSV